MPADESTNAEAGPSTSSNHIQVKSRSCDVCRRRKVRCEHSDGDSAKDAKCTNCRTGDIDCTYLSTGKPRPPSVSARVSQLEEQEERLKNLLRPLLPDVDLSGEIDVDKLALQLAIPEILQFDVSRKTSDNWDAQTELDSEEETLVPSNKDVSVPAAHKGRFFGKSSHVVLLKSIFDWKAEFREDAGGSQFAGIHKRMRQIRPDVWKTHSWEETVTSPPPVHPCDSLFPDPDLMWTLIGLYFEHANLFMPLLHRPIFQRLVLENIHFKDASMGAVVLLVCAIGARFSQDPRVLLNGTTLSAGWKWFHEAQQIEDRLWAPSSLYNIQADFLRAEFLKGASSCQTAWRILGVGMRRAQDVGAHRWQTFGTEKSAERELWTRAWWCLVVLDRIISAALGQPCVSDGWDFDVGLPTDCDDEFWEDHPDFTKRWKQPEGVPSKTSFFISHIKQTQILASTLGFLYANPKTKQKYMLEMLHDFDRRVVKELDLSLDRWVDGIPEHLRYPQNQQDPAFRRQAILLHAELYFLQILLHRPFLSTPEKTSAISICTNAARACSRLFDTEDGTCRSMANRVQWCIFSSAVVLLLSIWSGKRMGLDGSYEKEMQSVEKCLKMLSYAERCWQTAGQSVDIIRSLVDASDLTLSEKLLSSTPPSTWSSPSAASPNSNSNSNPMIAPSHAPRLLSDHGMPLNSGDLAKMQPPLYSGLPAYANTDPWTHTAPHGPGPYFTDMFQPQPEPTFPPYTQGYTGDGGGLFPPPPDVYSLTQQPASSLSISGGPNSLSGGPNYPTDPNIDVNVNAADFYYGLDPGPMPPDIFDSDTLAMWTSTPHGFNFGDWDAFVDNVNEVQMTSNMGHMRMM